MSGGFETRTISVNKKPRPWGRVWCFISIILALVLIGQASMIKNLRQVNLDTSATVQDFRLFSQRCVLLLETLHPEVESSWVDVIKSFEIEQK